MESFQNYVCTYMPFKMSSLSCYCAHFKQNNSKIIFTVNLIANVKTLQPSPNSLSKLLFAILWHVTRHFAYFGPVIEDFVCVCLCTPIYVCL